MAIWMDMTNSLVSWNRGMIGIIRAELLLAKYMHELDSKLRFSVCTDNGFREVAAEELSWLFEASNEGKAYGDYQARKKRMGISGAGTEPALPSCLEKLVEKLELRRHSRRWARSIHKRLVRFHLVSDDTTPKKLPHPYAPGDVIFSCGWFGSRKEEFFSIVKDQVPDIKIGYLVYDLVMVREDIRHLYYPADVPFEYYLKWITDNCDFVIYGGSTAQKDAEAFFNLREWFTPKGGWVRFGSELKISATHISIDQVLSKRNIHKPYIITVGSIEARKNYRVLYQAYCILALEKYEHIPDLVIIGQEFSDRELIAQFKENPLTKDKVHIFSPSDEELEVLYQNSAFTVLPSLYEGWSVVLPEMLAHEKLCLCSDVAPLREVGRDYAVYLDPRHPRAWADAIKHYSENRQEVVSWETRLHNEWKPVTWRESAHEVYEKLCTLPFSHDDLKSSAEDHDRRPSIYYDMTLFFYKGSLTGIPRAQLLLGRYIAKLNKNVKFFSLHEGTYLEVPRKYLTKTLADGPIDIAVREDNQTIPLKNLPRHKNFPFRKGDVVFSAGVGYPTKAYENIISTHERVGFTFMQLIYDFTPILIPHTHSQENLDVYPQFLARTYQLSDYIMYGGATAQHDGMEYQRSVLKQEPTPSFVIKFGSDIQSHSTTRKEEDEILKNIGIKGDFLLTVGTIEARKNHELLYEAYLELMRGTDDVDALPQLVICGRPGWKTEDFRQRLSVDRRIFGRIIMFSPSDEELDVLYKRCKFTLLASQYEGWSLTLPESFNYGKFCLAADVAPLREVGQDIIEYANPYDPEEWARKIRYYMLHPEALAEREKKIPKEWVNTTWKESAAYLNHTLVDILNAKGGADHDA
ncbi:glycosyltransferase [uncultured Mailhella sp.]|uniref:glycosyltransferase n=1 Tax=uncultured Mailhella sp. TaxID=1981031 RepID=UPI0025DBBB92|nr:glycosyltransferase [uncultured Mailhella sp.]